MTDNAHFRDIALPFTMAWEVGNHPNGGYISPEKAIELGDPGGETKWGISRRSYPGLDIAGLTYDGAAHIYFVDYWQTDPHSGTNQDSHCDTLPFPLNVVHFDCTVNVGNRKVAKDGTAIWHRKANMILQRALNVQDDGYVGPVTRHAIDTMDPHRAALSAITQRALYYATLGRWADTFRKGWSRRTNALRQIVLTQSQPIDA